MLLEGGDVITADNVEHVKDLLDPVAYHQVVQMGRRIRVRPQTQDVSKLFPHDFYQATLKNQGKAALDAKVFADARAAADAKAAAEAKKAAAEKAAAKAAPKKAAKPLKATAAEAVNFSTFLGLPAVVYLVVFFVIQSQVKEAQSMHLCVKYTTKDTCEGAGLPRTWLDATADVNLGNMSWPCSWNDAALVTDPYPCTNPNCGVEVLHMNANCIISEFDLLMFWLTTMLLVLQLMASQETGVWELDNIKGMGRYTLLAGSEMDEAEKVHLKVFGY